MVPQSGLSFGTRCGASAARRGDCTGKAPACVEVSRHGGFFPWNVQSVKTEDQFVRLNLKCRSGSHFVFDGKPAHGHARVWGLRV